MGAIIVLRIVHIGAGVFWAGGVPFMNFVVGPPSVPRVRKGVRGDADASPTLLHKILGAALLTILARAST